MVKIKIVIIKIMKKDKHQPIVARGEEILKIKGVD